MKMRLILQIISLCCCLLSALAWAVAANNMPTAGRILWLKAADLALTDGEQVTSWNDTTTRRQAVFTKVNGKGSAPIFVKKAFLDQPAVRFSGDSLLRVASLPLGTFTIAVVFKTASSEEILFRHGDSTKAFADGKDGVMLTTGVKNTFTVKRGGVATTKNASGEDAEKWATNADSPIVLIANYDASDDSMVVYRNGVPMLVTTVAGGLNNRAAITQAFDIGAQAVPGDMQFHGDIAELVVYDHILPKTAHRLLNSTLMSKYVPVPQYSDPTRVNVLEQWNSNGTYALKVSASAGDPTNAVEYALGGTGWYVGNSQNQPNNTVSARFTFPQPLRLAKVVLQWRENSHSPGNYTISDQTGVIISDTNGPFDGTLREHSFAPRYCEYLELSSNPANTEINAFECNMIRAYLAPEEVFPITGLTNILFEEDTKMKVSGTGYDPVWYDHSTSPAKPSSEGGSLTLHFSREYEMLGAFITHYDSQRYLAKARIEISRDGINWTSVYAADEYHFRANPELRNNGYITWDVPPDTDLTARWLRLSWGANENPVDITELQLFGRAL